MTAQPAEILTLDEVAVYLRTRKRTLYRLTAGGQLPGFKLGGAWRFRRSDLDAWIAERLGEEDPKVGK